MHDGMPYGRNQGQGQGHSKEVDRQYPTGLIFCFFILCSEHHYCGDQQWRSVTKKLNPPSAFVYFRWSWSLSCYFVLGLGLVSSGLCLAILLLVLVL